MIDLPAYPLELNRFDVDTAAASLDESGKARPGKNEQHGQHDEAYGFCDDSSPKDQIFASLSVPVRINRVYVGAAKGEVRLRLHRRRKCLSITAMTI